MPDYHEILHIFGTVQSSGLLLITRIGDLSPAIQQLRRVAADNEGKYPLLARWRLAELIGSHVARFLMLCNSRRTDSPANYMRFRHPPYFRFEPLHRDLSLSSARFNSAFLIRIFVTLREWPCWCRNSSLPDSLSHRWLSEECTTIADNRTYSR